jgi:hypothetical protein
VTLSCWEQGYLQIFYQNAPVTLVEANMTSLEARFYPSAANPVSKATIWITNASGSDTVVLTAANYLNYFGASFTREYGTAKVDDILQNGVNDSIIAIYRNPDLPLDVARLAVKVMPQSGARKAYYRRLTRDATPLALYTVTGRYIDNEGIHGGCIPVAWISASRILVAREARPGARSKLRLFVR